MLKLIVTAAALFGFTGSLFAQAPAPTEIKEEKPAMTQTAAPKAEAKKARKVKKTKKAKKEAKKEAKTEVAPAAPAPTEAPAPAAK